MNTAIECYIKSKGAVSSRSPAQEEILLRRREDAQLRLARIQNGAHPEYRNGHGGKKG